VKDRPEALEEIGRRLDRLVRRPFQVRSAWGRLAGPLLVRVGWRPRIRTQYLATLVARVQRTESSLSTAIASDARLLDEAVGELHGNVRRAERAVVVLGRLPDGHARWLWRLYELTCRAAEWVKSKRERTLLTELVRADAGHALRRLDPMAPGKRGAAARRKARAVDVALDAALAETRSLGRQRRLLEAARQLLLETSAEAEVDAQAARARRQLIARRIARLDRLQAAGVLPDVELAYQARQALERGEVQRLHAVLVAFEEGAFAAGDRRMRALASTGLHELWGRRARPQGAYAQVSLAESQRQLLGPAICEAVEAAYVGAVDQVAALRAERSDIYPEGIFEAAEKYLTERPGPATLAAAVASDGCFDVGVAASPVRVTAFETRPRAVRHPTQELVLAHAEGVDDVPQAEVDDPRALLLDLAAGRLLVRRYVAEERVPATRHVVRGEVRVFVLDGSGSMLGPRARVRDALLVAELATLESRLSEARRVWNPVLYYRYFNDQLGKTRRVSTRDGARAAIADVVATLRTGGTDIQGALVASFEQIAMARAADPALAAAQVVLVTDGEAEIDEQVLERARRGAGDLAIGVSIIALGNENPGLRRLAARQRAEGARIFYQFMDDDELRAIVDGETAGLPVHLVAARGQVDAPGPEALSAEVRSIVAEIERHARGLDAAQIEQARALPAALAEVGLGPEAAWDQAARARLAALENDRASLEGTFRQLFPGAGPAAAAGVDLDGVADEVVAALATVAEVVESYGAGSLERQSDAVELLERLLSDGGVAPWEYQTLVKSPPSAVAKALEAVRAACRLS
jgi:hypothetical protein